MRLADAWANVLPDSHQDALDTALQLEGDHFFEEFPEIAEESLAFVESSLGSHLPRKHAPRYTPLFAKRFFACFLTVAWKLAQVRQTGPPLSCVAEELALHALIEQAEALMEMEGLQFDFVGFSDLAYQDLDFEWLFDPEHDGIEDSDMATELAMANLRFNDWFKPFDNASTAIHPYARDDPQ